MRCNGVDEEDSVGGGVATQARYGRRMRFEPPTTQAPYAVHRKLEATRLLNHFSYTGNILSSSKAREPARGAGDASQLVRLGCRS